MKLKKNVIFSFITKFLLALMLVQFHLPSQIFCIESDGSSSIEIAPLGRCATLQKEHVFEKTTQLSQNCSQVHENSISCENCTDIPLNQEISQSRSDSKQTILKILSPSYFDLYAGGFKPYTPYPNQTLQPFPFLTSEFVYHPHQTLESIILII
jgi:hypothetical protein